MYIVKRHSSHPRAWQQVFCLKSTSGLTCIESRSTEPGKTWTAHSLQTPSLVLKLRNQKRKRNPKIHSELTKSYIANKNKTVTLRKMKISSTGQFKQKWKKRGERKREQKRKTFTKSPKR